MSARDELLVSLLERGFPSIQQTMEWLEERLANCLRLADEQPADKMAGWVEDAAYFAKTIAMLRTLAGVPPPAPTQH